MSARTPIKYQKCYKLSQCVLARYSSYYGVPKSCTLVFPFHCFLPSRILLPQFWHILHAAHSRPCHASFISEYRVSREFGSEHFLWETLCIVTSPSILQRSVVSYVLEVYHPSRHKYAWVVGRTTRLWIIRQIQSCYFCWCLQKYRHKMA